jgi:hypothetical protein
MTLGLSYYTFIFVYSIKSMQSVEILVKISNVTNENNTDVASHLSRWL